MARGLASAHAAGIVHRDIKPANVVFHDGSVKVVDFGIARLTEGNGETLTQAGFTTGTAAYLSPEQARGDKVDAASDVYSLGACWSPCSPGTAVPRDLPVAQARPRPTSRPWLTERRRTSRPAGRPRRPHAASPNGPRRGRRRRGPPVAAEPDHRRPAVLHRPDPGLLGAGPGGGRSSSRRSRWAAGRTGPSAGSATLSPDAERGQPRGAHAA